MSSSAFKRDLIALGHGCARRMLTSFDSSLGSTRSRRFTAILGATLALVSACGGDLTPTGPRGAEARGGQNPNEIAPQVSQRSDPLVRPAPDYRPRAQVAERTPRVVTERIEVPAEERAPARDLVAELMPTVEGAANCDLGDASRLTVSAVVLATGTISRASISGVDGPARDCVEARILAHRFAGPIENAPLTVNVQLAIAATRGEGESEVREVETGFALQPGQQAIAGPGGRGIQAASATEIGGPSGTPIGGAPEGRPIGGAPNAQPIQGPRGITIGQ